MEKLKYLKFILELINNRIDFEDILCVKISLFLR